MTTALTPRWTPMSLHPKQFKLWRTPSRFNVIPCGRRSGKTEIAKRKGVKVALFYCAHPETWVVFGAPTRAQAKRLFWSDLKKLVPPWARAGKPSESELTIRLVNGSEITVMGLDEPARIEGRPLDMFLGDEWGNTKPGIFDAHIRPALADRQGTGWLFGVPEGRNHYFETYEMALADTSGEWAVHHWTSAEVLPLYLGAEIARRELASAKRDMDPLVYKQEFEASFINFTGRAYYNFDRDRHVDRLIYDPDDPLILCFDFNRSPGVCCIVQEQLYRGSDPDVLDDFTAVIDEVYIKRDSTTPKVCHEIVKKYGEHRGPVLCYGDATGGAKKSSSVMGSDIDLIRQSLKPVFGARLKMRFARSNPSERSRVNSLNSRIMNGQGKIALLVDGRRARMTIRDLEGVIVVDGGAGEIDKKYDSTLTHLSDGLGYYIHEKFPMGRVPTVFSPLGAASSAA